MKFLDKEQREQVGFSFIMERLQVVTPFGIEEKKNIKPFRKKEKSSLIKELDNVETIKEKMQTEKGTFRELAMVFCKVKDIRNTMKRCTAGEVLDEVELYEVKYFAMISCEIEKLYSELKFNMDAVDFMDLSKAVELLDPEGKGLSTFYIYEGYSEKLKKIRDEKRNLEDKILRSESSGDIAAMKDERLKLVIQEEEEEYIIRRNLSDKLKSFMPSFQHNTAAIGRLDMLIAKAAMDGTRPVITDEDEIEFKEAYNPQMAEILAEKGKKFTPLNIQLKKGTTLITGANMGGKSVALKTIVLNLLLGQMGFFVFCREARMPIVDFIYFISDDLQSVSKGLSTFGAEIIKLKSVIENVKTEKGFAALDEFARGTNPEEGYYLVKSLSEYLNKFSTISLISTHYDGVAEKGMVHYQVAGLKNVDFDALKLKLDLSRKNSVEIIQDNMDYSLERVPEDNPVPKDALNICTLLGLEEDIVDIARKYYEKQ